MRPTTLLVVAFLPGLAGCVDNAGPVREGRPEARPLTAGQARAAILEAIQAGRIVGFEAAAYEKESVQWVDGPEPGTGWHSFGEFRIDLSKRDYRCSVGARPLPPDLLGKVCGQAVSDSRGRRYQGTFSWGGDRWIAQAPREANP